MKKLLILLAVFVFWETSSYAQKDLTFFGELGFIQPNLSSGTYEKTIDNTTEHMNLETAGGYILGITMKTLKHDTLQGIHFQLGAAFSSYYLTNNIKESIASYDAITQKTNTYITNYRYIDAVQYFRLSPAVNGDYEMGHGLSIDAALAMILNTPLSRGYNMYVSSSATAGLIYNGIEVFASYEVPFGRLFKTYLDGQGVFSEFTPTVKQSALIVGLRVYPSIFFRNIYGCNHDCSKGDISK